MYYLTHRDIEIYVDALSKFAQGDIENLDVLLHSIDVAIECLKHRDAKTPKLVKKRPYYRDHAVKHYVCPTCHKQVKQRDSYCRYCGQGLKWNY